MKIQSSMYKNYNPVVSVFWALSHIYKYQLLLSLRLNTKPKYKKIKIKNILD